MSEKERQPFHKSVVAAVKSIDEEERESVYVLGTLLGLISLTHIPGDYEEIERAILNKTADVIREGGVDSDDEIELLRLLSQAVISLFEQRATKKDKGDSPPTS